jgi:Tol biopolymer transport system component
MLNESLAIRDLNTKKVRTLVEATPGMQLTSREFSPDGSRVAYSRRPNGPFTPEKEAAEEVIVVNVDGTKSRAVYRGGAAYAWSADGKRLLVEGTGQAANATSLAWVDIATGAVQKLPTTYTNLVDAKVSADGKFIAFNASKDANAQENVYVMAADGSGEMLISPSAAYQEPIEWTPDGKQLVYAQYGTSAILWSVPVVNGSIQGPAVNTHVDFGRSAQFRGVTRAGALYFRILTSTSDVYTATMDLKSGRVTSAPTPVPADRTGANVGPRWAPDSRRLAYEWAESVATSSPSRPWGGRELSVYSFDTGKAQRMATQAKLATGAYCWSRDGGSILFNSAENLRQPEAVRLGLSNDQIAPVFPGAAPFSLRHCSGDLGAGLGARGIIVRNFLSGSEKEVYRITPNIGTVLPVLSHDGRNVAFVTPGVGPRVTGGSAIHVVSSDGGPVRELISVGPPTEFQATWGVTWSSDDRFVYFARRADGQSPYELMRVPATGGAAESMGLRVEDLRDLDIAPDGTRIAFSIGAVNRPEIWALQKFLPSE